MTAAFNVTSLGGTPNQGGVASRRNNKNIAMLPLIQDALGTSCSVRLPFAFDVQNLVADLEIAEQFEFHTHPLRYHDGSWRAINLVYGGGRNHYTHTGDHGYGDGPPEATEVLRACPYFQRVLGELGHLRMARLSALPPGGKILRHYDPIESVDFGQLRIHIPIRSDPNLVVFHLAFQRQRWRPGEAWYGDFTFPHSVTSNAPYMRVTMIVDVTLDDRYRAMFPTNYFSERAIRRRAWLRAEMRSWSWRLKRLHR